MPKLGNFFGGFTTDVSTGWEGDESIKSGGPIVITHAVNVESPLRSSPEDYSIVVHIGWGDDFSAWVGGGPNDIVHHGGGNGGEIPEFPSIALPVAAIMGIMFFMGRRGKTE
ncbi:PEF-CTERM sorting domain-containing protein [Methanosarcina sp. KYL-1]|nr:PEF-CTERM sorting domain-containing protein [Methanosarcina sp. KYL-1]